VSPGKEKLRLAFRKYSSFPDLSGLERRRRCPILGVQRKEKTGSGNKAGSEKEKIMFANLKRAAKLFRAQTATEAELAYLNDAGDRLDLEARQRNVDRGLLRKGTYAF
jgi:hypothetical protein